MKKLQVIMPMAGLGSRFVKEGYTIPKPLIMVDNKPMFLRALESVEDFKCEKKYIFIIREEHNKKFDLKSQIKYFLPEAQVITIDNLTRGSVETCLKAESCINCDDGVLVMDCDLYFKSLEYENIIEETLKGNTGIDGGLLSFNSDNDRYSYAKVKDGFVIETAEKKVISNNALVGAYFFATGKIFIEAAKQLLNGAISKEIPEYYTSLLYNYVLTKKGKVMIASIEKYCSFGTPEELNNYKTEKK